MIEKKCRDVSHHCTCVIWLKVQENTLGITGVQVVHLSNRSANRTSIQYPVAKVSEH